MMHRRPMLNELIPLILFDKSKKMIKDTISDMFIS
jgi:hypothetical protein